MISVSMSDFSRTGPERMFLPKRLETCYNRVTERFELEASSFLKRGVVLSVKAGHDGDYDELGKAYPYYCQPCGPGAG